ncbi:MAG TPA: single-stranded DNA-binding protein [Bacillota bacterium]|nr:single-stranded DNA-binding protein [Bacillota bacterium]
MLNKVILIGRLTRDPELRYTPNTGTAVGSFTLAVNRVGGKQEETDFIDIVVWSKQAENCAQYLRKGSLAAVDGRLQIRSYETKEGQKRRVAEVVASSVQFLSGRQSGANPDAEGGVPERRNFDEFAGGSDNFTDDEDVPF